MEGKTADEHHLQVYVTMVGVMCGSPAGVAQLINYFDLQSRRLDKQSYHHAPFNSDFESLIKFNGVPILPPAITSSRRDELIKHKKDAVLLEKRLKARQRRHLLPRGGDASSLQPMGNYPEFLGTRPAARQLNFDSQDPYLPVGPSLLQERLEATNPLSTYAAAETLEDFALQTLDSVGSDFMSMDESSIPKLFSGLALTSFKEQKISYDLDRLSKALKLGSTSGSDLSDTVGSSRATEEDDTGTASRFAEKLLVHRGADAGDSQSASFFHESQDTVVEVSPEPGDNTITSGFVENTNSSNLEQSQNSPGSSPGYGSAHTNTTPESQLSNRSSPKSLKSTVHFSSYVTEYNPRASQNLCEHIMVVKKKISYDNLIPDSVGQKDVVLPRILNPGETRQKHMLSQKLSDPETSNVFQFSVVSDQDSSQKTSPAHSSIGWRSETHGSDKENDNVHKSSNRGHRKSPDQWQGESGQLQDRAGQSVGQSSSSTGTEGQPFLNITGASHMTSSHDHSEQTDQSVSHATSVSDSQASSKISGPALTSGSSSSTIRDSVLALNITESVSEDVPPSSHDSSDHPSATSIQTSPKKLNTNTTSTEDDPEDPPTAFVRRGSYTLSEPSPALLRVRSKLKAEQKQRDTTPTAKLEKAKDKIKSQTRNAVKSQAVGVKDGVEEKRVGSLTPSQSEQEGKAEHINKYLSQVQFQNSMNFSTQSWEVSHLTEDGKPYFLPEEGGEDEEHDTSSSILEILKSMSESQGSVDAVSVEELLSLHQQQMERKRQELINQQQQEMEELFVQQRREVMLLEAEIKAAQQQEREHEDFIIKNAPENIKVKSRNHTSEFSPQNTIDSIRVTLAHQVVDHISESSSTGQKTQQGNMKVLKNSHSKGRIVSKNVANDTKRHLKKFYEDNESCTASFSPQSDTPHDPVGIANRIPEFSPSAPSPRIHRPLVIRSPLKTSSVSRHEGHIFVPPKAHHPEFQAKFDRVSAVAKGFLTRCLLRSDKVQELIKTIHDTREFAFNFQTETPIKKGVFSSQDRALLERIVAQLQAALLDIHEIFFEIPPSDRMALIEQTRIKEYEKRIKSSTESMRGSGPRISQATLKALERKKKARETEASSSMGSTRTMSVPSLVSNGKLQNQMDLRALKPLQGQSHSYISKTKENSRLDKDRHRAGSEKQLTKPKRITAPAIKPALSAAAITDSNKEGMFVQKTIATSRNTSKSKMASNKTSGSRAGTSWR
ncbi:uncharacterized protein LOC131941545 isoform X2 [Physella acuta]|uniref:uncharacterized protein LOC131941545 isoform X2 n=1 Tax=Physella acuta TaxID=109671 RepID=UPI0027DB32C4|nr:uncharacterized protein LOC131941545 isoform X2 [Physella acuta]